jgi:WD40 repeat protein
MSFFCSPLEGHAGLLYSAAFSPDGKRIVTASGDDTARWDAETGKPIGAPLEGHAGSVLSAAFNPNGKRIVTGSEDKTARLWDIFANTQDLMTHAKTVARAPGLLDPACNSQTRPYRRPALSSR